MTNTVTKYNMVSHLFAKNKSDAQVRLAVQNHVTSRSNVRKASYMKRTMWGGKCQGGTNELSLTIGHTGGCHDAVIFCIAARRSQQAFTVARGIKIYATYML